MRKTWSVPLFLLVVLGLTLASPAALATVYDFSSSFPGCSNGSWSQSGGSTYTCTSGSTSLASGDSIVSTKNITVVAEAGITLAGNNTIGSTGKAVNLVTTYGALTASNGATFYGDLSADSGAINLTNAVVHGNLTTNGTISLSGGSVSGDVSGRNGVTTSGTVIVGDVTATNGPISLSGGSVGTVYSNCCSLTTNGTDIKGDVNATIGSGVDTVSITGGTISGAISTSGGKGISITNATVTSGSITTTSVPITISNSDIGTPSSPVNITNNGKQSITITGGSTVYGNVTTGGTLTVTPPAVIYGDCSFQSITGACTPYVPGPDHIRVFFNNNTTALTCAPRRLDAIACKNSNCSTRFASAVSVTLSPGGAAATIPAGGTGTPSVAQTTEGTSTIALAASNPAAGGVLCYAGTVASPGAAATCSLTFSAAGFFVSVPDHVSGVTQTLTITAAKTDNKTKTCVPAFDNGVSRNVKLRFTYVNPASGATPPVFPKVGSVSPPTSSLATASDLSLAMTFTDGVAKPYFRYDDAGSLSVSASYTGSAATGDVGLVMATVANLAFVVAPANFLISDIPAAPLTAGSPFNITVTARNNSNVKTANFGAEVPTAATALLTSSNPLPAPGNATAISKTLSGFSKGVASTDLTWNEVGTVDVTATTSAYLGSALNVVGSQAAVGRFKPAYFDTIVSHGCSGVFTYAGLVTPAIAGQPFTVEVKAKRSGGDLTDSTNTANYAGATWAKAVTLSDANSGSGTLANNSFAAADFAAGKALRSDVSYALANKLTAPYTLVIRATENSGGDGVNSSGHNEGSTQTRSGRLRLISGQGSEQAPFVVKSEAQYWNGSYWQTNAADNCTSYAVGNALVSGGTGTAVSTVTGIKSGYGTLTLSKPTTAGLASVCLDTGTLAGDGCIAASPGSIGYLRGNWKVATVFDQDPSATVQFGGAASNSRGNWGFLYRRENF